MSLSATSWLCIQAILPQSSLFGECSTVHTLYQSPNCVCVCLWLHICCCRRSLTVLKENLQKLLLLRQQSLELLLNPSGQPMFTHSSTWVRCCTVCGVVLELLSRACYFQGGDAMPLFPSTPQGWHATHPVIRDPNCDMQRLPRLQRPSQGISSNLHVSGSAK